MKKLCYITTTSVTLEAFIQQAAEYLYDKNNYDITFISSPDSDFAEKLPSHIKFIPVQMKRGVDWTAFQSIIKIYKILKNEKFDYIQFSTPNASLYASIASFFAKTPIRVYAQWGIVYVQFKGVKRLIYKTMEKLVCSLSTRVQPDSYGNLRFAKNEKLYSAHKGHVIWNGSACGVDLAKFDILKKDRWNNEIREKYNLSKDDFVLGFVGRVKKEKGIEELLTSFLTLVPFYENIKLIIVGEMEAQANIDEKLLKRALNHKNIIFTGKSKEVEKIMASFNLFVLPSYREGFGSVVIEASSMGVASIVSDIPGPTEAIISGETGEVFDKESHTALTTVIKEFLEAPSKSESMGYNARDFVASNFNKESFFIKLDENIKQLLYPSLYHNVEEIVSSTINPEKVVK